MNFELLRATSVWTAGFLFAAAPASAHHVMVGLFHGYAFGESIYGAEKSPLGAYLLGLVLIQTALTLGIVIVMRRLKTDLSGWAPRLAGAVIVGVGFATLTGHIIPPP